MALKLALVFTMIRHRRPRAIFLCQNNDDSHDFSCQKFEFFPAKIRARFSRSANEYPFALRLGTTGRKQYVGMIENIFLCFFPTKL